MRINKFISETGICSRREADKLIEAEKVTINGSFAKLGSTVELGDEVLVNGKPVGVKKKSDYIVLNKPVGITCTTEKHIEGNIVDFINYPERIFPIGRLDKDSQGLIMLTNDGDIVNRLLRSENEHEKEYIVSVNKRITSAFIEKMSSGVDILDAKTKPCKVIPVNNRVFSIVLTQGLNRQIRRMCSALGYHVVQLERIRIMNIKINGLKIGQWRKVTNEELHELFEKL